MPINRDEFLKKSDIPTIVVECLNFLKDHSNLAYTSPEIAKELDISETKVSIALDALARAKKIKSSFYKGARYYTVI